MCMYVEHVPNRSRNSRPTTFVGGSSREGPILHKRTVANISHWPHAKIEALRCLLRDEPVTGCIAYAPVKPKRRGWHRMWCRTIKTLKMWGKPSVASSRWI